MAVSKTKLQPVPTQTSVSWSREQIELVKRTVAKDATDDELKMFLYLANQYRLDPFKREIVFTKFKGQPSFITTRDGYLKIAISNPDFDGLQAFVVREGDDFEIVAEEFKVHHRFGSERGKIIGAWAAAYHKKRKPVICFVEFDEYYKPEWNTWEKYPSAMIQKVAESFVLKRQFNISGLVTQEEISMEEINTMEDTNIVEGTIVDSKPSPNEEGKWRKAVFASINDWAKDKGLNESEASEKARKILREAYKVSSCSELTEDTWKQIYTGIDRLIKRVEDEILKEAQETA